jgi:predicted ester cyclase
LRKTHHDATRLEDGKFAEVWDHADMDAVMRQIGQDEARR